jgi:hypothetical protein
MGEHLNICEAVEIECKNEGCDVSIPREDLSAHITSDCLFKPTKCSHAGCDAIVPRRDLASHMCDCDDRIAYCRHCGKGIVFRKMSEHMDVCEAAEILCQNEGCEARILRRDVVMHGSICPHGIVECPHFARHGLDCGGQMLLRKDAALHHHEAAAFHAEHLAERLASCEAETSKLKASFDKQIQALELRLGFTNSSFQCLWTVENFEAKMSTGVSVSSKTFQIWCQGVGHYYDLKLKLKFPECPDTALGLYISHHNKAGAPDSKIPIAIGGSQMNIQHKHGKAGDAKSYTYTLLAGEILKKTNEGIGFLMKQWEIKNFIHADGSFKISAKITIQNPPGLVVNLG